MQSIKLHEATKQFKISNKLAMFFLEKKNLGVKSHSSVISMEQLELLREFSAGGAEFDAVQKEFKAAEKARKSQPAAEAAPVAPPQQPLEKESAAAPGEAGKAEAPATSPPPKKPEQAAAAPGPAPATTPPAEKKQPTAPASSPRMEPAAKSAPAASAPKGASQERRIGAPAKATPEAPARRDAGTVDRSEEIRRAASRPMPPESADAFMPKVPASRPRQRFRQPSMMRRPRRGGGRGAGARKQPPTTLPPKLEEMDLPEAIRISDFVTIKELSEQLNIKLKTLALHLQEMGREYLANQIIQPEDVAALCEKLGVKLEVESYEDYVFGESLKQKGVAEVVRAPVVTVMGHVDHGKTTLLDTLRKTRVAAGEAGGITQSIGAYKLNVRGNDIIFIDTPGHEAFTNLRARGAKVTDLVILVVAANDGVQPQTVEAINHARSAGVPMIVAINKMDMEGADANRVKQELNRHEVLVEDWGGEVVSVEISAKEGTNLDALLEMIVLVSEMQELKMYAHIPGRGTIIESRLDPKLGPIGTLLLLHGDVNRGDYFICGNAVGKVKTIFDDKGKVLNKASAPIPVEIMGFDGVPDAGDMFQVVKELDKAAKVIEIRLQREKDGRKQEVEKEKKLSLHNLFEKMQETEVKSIPVVVKADNFGSAEVLQDVLLRRVTDKVKISIIHSGIGNITESDILLASTSDALILGFNVKAPQKIMSLAKQEGIEIKLYNVIYHLMEEMERAIRGEMEPEYEETHIGTIEVLQKFKISKIGIVAGCLVREGKVTRKSRIKVLRDKDLVFEGEVETLRRIKNDVSEVKAGTECGIRVRNFNAIEVGDTLEAYELTEKSLQ
ncbi:MAG: translation initiation factor IF-2 [Acidobacteriota bacterium]|jgi:translation initiation factor IF-2|nr:translation initiation factor IF-2 [Acidobacteriota bacterium]